jgi:serine acetyltransferase
VIGAGAVVIGDVPAGARVLAEPSRIIPRGAP